MATGNYDPRTSDFSGLTNIKQKITNLILKANNTTGKSDADLTSSVNSLIDGCGKVSQVVDKTVTKITARDLATATKIGNYAFVGCTELASIEIPNSVTNIGYKSFVNCTSLRTITIPDSITSIDELAFSGCTALDEVHITSLEAWNNISFGDAEANPMYYASKLYLNGILLSNITFVSNGGTELGTMTLMPGDALPPTSREGFTFGGWFADAKLSNIITVVPSKSMTVYAYWTEENKPTDFTYYEEEDCIEIITYVGSDTDVCIPMYINGKTITSIGYRAFLGCTGLMSITIPDSVTSIGESAFSGCYKLIEVCNLSNLTITAGSSDYGYIGYYAKNIYTNTDGTSKLQKKDGYVFYIDSDKDEYYLLAYEDSNTELTLPDNINSNGYGIYEYAFKGCTGLTDVTIGNGVTSIGDNAFSGCDALTSITIPDSVTSIGSGAFSDCYSLTSIVIPDSVTSIGSAAFSGCTELTSVDISDSVTSIEDFVFHLCTGLTSIVIPDGVTSIGENAFSSCSGLIGIAIPDSITSIGYAAFRGCDGLFNVYYTGTEEDWNSISIGSDNSPLLDATIHFESEIEPEPEPDPNPEPNIKFVSNGGTELGTMILKSGDDLPSVSREGFTFGGWFTEPELYHTITVVPSKSMKLYAYWTEENKPTDFLYFETENGVEIAGYVGDPTDVRMPKYINGKAVTLIRNSAFYGNDTFTTMAIPDSVISIGDYAFRGCTGLTSITIPDSVTSIGHHAFCACFGLRSVTIGNGVTNIGDNAFFSCTLLDDIYVSWNEGDVEGAPWGATGATIYYNTHRDGSLLFRDVDGGYEVSGIAQVVDRCIIIPSEYNGLPVVSIGKYAFGGGAGLTNIVIPNSVTNIERYAFNGCNDLESITIPFIGKNADETSITYFGYIFGALSGVQNDDYVPASLRTIIVTGGTVIGDSAFSGCSGLTSITIPDSITSIGVSAFSGCTGLTEIVIPDAVTSIGEAAFYKCSTLRSITIPYSVTIIEQQTFSDCDALTEIVIPDAVTSIGMMAFQSCSGLTSIMMGKSVTSIGNSAFLGCTSLTDVYYSGSEGDWNSISVDSFNSSLLNATIHFEPEPEPEPEPGVITYELSAGGTYAIVTGYDGTDTEVVIADTYSGVPVTKISSQAFKGNSNIASVTIPDSVTSIGAGAFYGCTSLTSIVIPDSVTSLSGEVFYNCTGLTSITIPNSVTNIGVGLFNGCTNLASITIPDSVGRIQQSAFRNCTSLTSIEIPDNVTRIDDTAFYNCTGLTSITIPNGVTYIDQSAFAGCSNLEDIYVPWSEGEVANAPWGATNATIHYGGEETDPTYFEYSETEDGIEITGYIGNDTDVRIPEAIDGKTVTSIGEYAFEDCDGLTSIDIPNGVTSIGDSAFYGCDELTSVTIGNGVTSIGDGAFNGCSGLTSITVVQGNTKYHSDGNCLIETTSKTLIEGCKTSIIPSDGSVTSIGDYAFSYCDGLTEIVIPDSVTSIGNSAFSGCTGLTSIEIPNSVMSIGAVAFEDCDGLTSIVIPDSVTSIGDAAFYACDELTSVTIGNGVTSIGDGVFANCTKLKSVKIGNGVTEIIKSAFDGCDGLTDIYVPWNKGNVAGAPWGAINATIHYNSEV